MIEHINKESGKIDIHHVQRDYETALKNLENDERILSENKKLILKFLRDCELGKTIKKGQKKKIGAGRCLKMQSMLKTMSLWLKKPFDKVTQDEMEAMIIGLERDKLKGSKKKYSDNTKADFKKILRKFYKWLWGNNETYPEIVSWIDTSTKDIEIPALRKEEIEKMIELCPTIRDKAIIMTLFDSGARIEEMLNVRLKHLIQNEDGSYKIRIEFSKTKPRTISIPYCTKLINEWLAEYRIKYPKEMKNLETPLFPVTYPQVFMMIKRNGMKALKKNIYPHLLRHSSVTHYANLFPDPFKLNKRYGWAMASDMANRYIDREGINEEDVIDAVKVDEITKYKKENEKVMEEMIKLRGEVEKYQEKFDNITSPENFEEFIEKLKENIFKNMEKRLTDKNGSILGKKMVDEIKNKKRAEFLLASYKDIK